MSLVGLRGGDAEVGKNETIKEAATRESESTIHLGPPAVNGGQGNPISGEARMPPMV